MKFNLAFCVGMAMWVSIAIYAPSELFMIILMSSAVATWGELNAKS